MPSQPHRRPLTGPLGNCGGMAVVPVRTLSQPPLGLPRLWAKSFLSSMGQCHTPICPSWLRRLKNASISLQFHSFPKCALKPNIHFHKSSPHAHFLKVSVDWTATHRSVLWYLLKSGMFCLGKLTYLMSFHFVLPLSMIQTHSDTWCFLF